MDSAELTQWLAWYRAREAQRKQEKREQRLQSRGRGTWWPSG